MTLRVLCIASLCVATLVAGTAVADFADDNLAMALKEVRDLRAQMQRLEKKVDGLLSRMDQLEKAHAEQPPADPPPIQKRLGRDPVRFFLERSDGVDEVMRLQFGSPNRLLDHIHEREERLRHRLFPAENPIRE